MVEIQGVVLEDSENPSIHGRSYQLTWIAQRANVSLACLDDD
jgi:hypothetical protein